MEQVACMEESLIDLSSTRKARDDRYLKAAMSRNTRQAYESDLNDFVSKGGQLPAAPGEIIDYLKTVAADYNPRTLRRRIIAIRQWHLSRRCPDPTKTPEIIKTMQGIMRIHGIPRKQAAPIMLKDLDQLITYLDKKCSLKSKRDKALLLIGFFGALRRSELSSLQWSSVQFVGDGLVVQVSRSKTDQEGQGADCVIPFGRDHLCPVQALLDWKQESGVYEGGIFRHISKAHRVLEGTISSRHINRLVKVLAASAGLTYSSQMSAHSLRRGFATEAARLGATMPAIQRHGRWKSIKTVSQYIDLGRQFADSAVNVLFQSAD